jgi:hypothetical protein
MWAESGEPTLCHIFVCVKYLQLGQPFPSIHRREAQKGSPEKISIVLAISAFELISRVDSFLIKCGITRNENLRVRDRDRDRQSLKTCRFQSEFVATSDLLLLTAICSSGYLEPRRFSERYLC